MSNDLIETVNALEASLPRNRQLPDQAWHIFRGLLQYHAKDKNLSRFYVREFSLPRHPKSAGSKTGSPALVIMETLAEVAAREQKLGRVREALQPKEISLALFSLYYMALSHFLMGRFSLPECSAYLRTTLKTYFEGARASK